LELDCGSLFLASAHLALLYHSRGDSLSPQHQKLKEEAVREAMQAHRTAFALTAGTDTGTATGTSTSSEAGGYFPVPESLGRILDCLQEICPSSCQDCLPQDETSGTTGDSSDATIEHDRICYTKQQLLEIMGNIEPASEECVKTMLAGIGYESIDLVVDIHPDNLLPPSRKKGGGKNSSNTKKKKAKNQHKDTSQHVCSFSPPDESVAISLDKLTPDSDGVIGETNLPGVLSKNSPSSSEKKKNVDVPSPKLVPTFSAGQALAWADNLDVKLQEAIGDRCILLTEVSQDVHDNNKDVL
jgi:hypothetical protein